MPIISFNGTELILLSQHPFHGCASFSFFTKSGVDYFVQKFPNNNLNGTLYRGVRDSPALGGGQDGMIIVGLVRKNGVHQNTNG